MWRWWSRSGLPSRRCVCTSSSEHGKPQRRRRSDLRLQKGAVGVRSASRLHRRLVRRSFMRRRNAQIHTRRNRPRGPGALGTNHLTSSWRPPCRLPSSKIPIPGPGMAPRPAVQPSSAAADNFRDDMAGAMAQPLGLDMIDRPVGPRLAHLGDQAGRRCRHRVPIGAGWSRYRPAAGRQARSACSSPRAAGTGRGPMRRAAAWSRHAPNPSGSRSRCRRRRASAARVV
jgi:hypothetical protein